MQKGHGLGLHWDPSLPRPRLPRRLQAGPDLPVNRKLNLPYYLRAHMDQGEEGACVGFGYSWMMSILNRRKYDAFWLYNEAKKIDPWPGEAYSGTSEVAGADVLMQQGHRRIYYGYRMPNLGRDSGGALGRSPECCE